MSNSTGKPAANKAKKSKPGRFGGKAFKPKKPYRNGYHDELGEYHPPVEDPPGANGGTAKKEATWAPADPKFAKLNNRYKWQLDNAPRDLDLGVPIGIIKKYGLGWRDCNGQRSWTFPTFNGDGEVCGITRRFLDGKKKMMKGGKSGVFLPADWEVRIESTKLQILIPEGVRDCASAAACGFFALGRFNCGPATDDILIALLANAKPGQKVVVMAERDLKDDGRVPGVEGAINTAQAIKNAHPHLQVSWALPPGSVKDLQDWYQQAERPRRKTLLDWLSLPQKNHVIEVEEDGSYKPQWRPKSSGTVKDWIIEDILVALQPGVIGGPVKAMKTSLSLELAICMAYGRPFLGRYRVPKRFKVFFVSGESGEETIGETADLILKAKGLKYDPNWLGFDYDLPDLSAMEQVEALIKLMKSEGGEIVFLDPFYLCGVPVDQVASVHGMGGFLKAVARPFTRAGITPFLNHHTLKNTFNKREPLDLIDLAGAGISEFARQWILINRRKPYEYGERHDLNVVLGGSKARCSQTLSVMVDEGTREKGFRWAVEAKPWQEAKHSRKETDVQIKIIKQLRQHPEGLSITCLRSLVKGNNKAVSDAASALVERGIIRRDEGCPKLYHLVINDEENDEE